MKGALTMTTTTTTTPDLLQIPGVGPAIAALLESLGVTSIARLKNRSPERLYKKLCDRSAAPVDRCVLYVFRCAVYYVSNTDHDPDLLNWWNWKDRD